MDATTTSSPLASPRLATDTLRCVLLLHVTPFAGTRSVNPWNAASGASGSASPHRRTSDSTRSPGATSHACGGSVVHLSDALTTKRSAADADAAADAAAGEPAASTLLLRSAVRCGDGDDGAPARVASRASGAGRARGGVYGVKAVGSAQLRAVARAGLRAGLKRGGVDTCGGGDEAAAALAPPLPGLAPASWWWWWWGGEIGEASFAAVALWMGRSRFEGETVRVGAW